MPAARVLVRAGFALAVAALMFSPWFEFWHAAHCAGMFAIGLGIGLGA